MRYFTVIIFLLLNSLGFSQDYLITHNKLITEGKYEEALNQLEKVELELTPTEVTYYQVRFLQSDIFWETGELDRLKTNNLEDLKHINKQDHLPDTIEANILANLGGYYFYQGDYIAAIPYFESCLEILTPFTDQEESVAMLNNNLGLLYGLTGELEKSVNSLTLAEQYFIKTNDQQNLFFTLINLGNTSANLYRLETAEKQLEEAIFIGEKEGLNHTRDFVNGLLSLSTLYIQSGKVTKAEKAIIQVDNIVQTNFGTASEEYAAVLNNYASLYKYTGDLGNAERYNLKALEVKEQVYSTHHPSYVTTENNLLLLKTTLGRFNEAKEGYNLMFKRIRTEKANHAQAYPSYLNNFASLYQQLGEQKKAIKYYEEAILYSKEYFGEGSHESITQIINLAGVLIETNDLPEAEILLKSLPIKQLSTLDLSYYHNEMGLLFMKKKSFPVALEHFNKALDFTSKTGNYTNEQRAKIKINLGVCLEKENKIEQAAIALQEGLQELIDYTIEQFPTLTAVEKSIYVATLFANSNYFYSFVAKHGLTLPKLLPQCLDFRLQTKALALRSDNSIKLKIANSTNKQLKTDYNDLTTLKSEVSKYKRLNKNQLKKSNYPLEEKALELAKVEKEFYLTYGKELTSNSFFNTNSLQKSLSSDQAAIEIFRCTNETYDVEYFAIIIYNNKPPVLVKLGGESLEKKHYSFYKNTINLKVKSGQSYEAYWEPITPHLNGIKQVFISPDGVYHKISLNTLYNANTKKYLIEDIYITNKLSLSLSSSLPEKNQSKNIALFGHPAYYLDLKNVTSELENKRQPTLRSIQPDFVEWTDLPGTKQEVLEIEKILVAQNWKTELYTEERALENYIKKVNNPEILHIATHGYFDQTSDTSSNQSFESPLFKSSLILSGGGLHYTLADVNSPYFENGVLSAYEAQFLNLQHTNLVVLSACQTGLGDERNEEGIYGLQRSFKIAGAKNIIMSLWEVDDNATKDLMIAFYSNIASGKNNSEAFHTAMLTIKEKYDSPYYWGAFVLSQ